MTGNGYKLITSEQSIRPEIAYADDLGLYNNTLKNCKIQIYALLIAMLLVLTFLLLLLFFLPLRKSGDKNE
jgi:hypothetical protein